LAVGDGAGCPIELWGDVLELLAERPDVSVVLGWWFDPPEGDVGLEPGRATTLLSGFGLRRLIDAGRVGFVPSRMSQAPNLLFGPLRPDVLVTSLRPRSEGFSLTTEVAWEAAAIDAGATVAAVIRPDAPAIASSTKIEVEQVVVLSESGGLPLPFVTQPPTDLQRAVAEQVASLICEGVRVQVGPGGLGAAVFEAIDRPVAVDTGIVTDPVIDLFERGLLVGEALAPYVAGSAEVYAFAADHARIERVEITHDLARLSTGRPMVAVNTAMEIDLDGQVNAELAGGSAAGGIGGQPDYALGASLSREGLSIMALASCRPGGSSTLVESLSGPVTTPCFDLDVVVTERGHADLRGLSRPERRQALQRLWGADAP
jgi:acyl-CoA hydrolase